MTVEFLLIAYAVWSLIAALCYLRFDEEGKEFAFAGCVGPLLIAAPPGLFLLLDGEWCEGDCLLIAALVFGVSLMIMLARIVAAPRE